MANRPLSELHAALAGLKTDAQIDLLVAAEITADDLREMDDAAASEMRPDNPEHKEDPSSGSSICPTCGDVDDPDDPFAVDLYFHPLGAMAYANPPEA